MKVASTALEFEAIGTHWVIDLYDSSTRAFELLPLIQNRISVFDKVYSRFQPDSLITAIAKKPGLYAFPKDAEPLFFLYQKLYQLTGGAFTPLIGQVMEDAGYDAHYSLESRKLEPPPTWEEAMVYKEQHLTTKRPIVLDFGAGGKGYLVDLVGKMLVEQGVSSFCIDAGGDILYRHKDAVKLKVGLEDPDDVSCVIGLAEVENASICGSAGNRRTWGEYHHIIDPRTLDSPRHILATWVVAKEGLVADALATALFLVPSKVLRTDFSFEYLIMYADRSVETSKNWKGELFVENT